MTGKIYTNISFLKEEYIDKSKSAKQIAEELNVDPVTIVTYLKKFGIFDRNHGWRVGAKKREIEHQNNGGKSKRIGQKISSSIKRVWENRTEDEKRAILKNATDVVLNRIPTNQIINRFYKTGFWVNRSTGNREVYRSSYELKFMLKMNSLPGIQYTSKHNIVIEYVDHNKKKRKYYPDFLINNRILVEIKPKQLVNHPKNLAKFKAAKIYCTLHGLEFEIWTQKRLGL